MSVYDDKKQRGDTSDLQDITGINPAEAAEMERTAMRGAADDIAEREGLFNPDSDYDASEGGSGKDKKTDSAKDLKDKESGGGSARLAGGVNGAMEGLASGGGPMGALKGFAKGLVSKKNRKKTATGAGVGVGIVSIVLGIFNVGQGPFQMIHAAQLLQGIHMSDQDDFGDGLSAKYMIYAIAGKAAKGRLGIIQNVRADRLEKRLNESGLKSVYSPTLQRLIGYQIIDIGAAQTFVNDMDSDGVPRTATMNGVGIDGKPIDVSQGTFVNFQGERYRTARSVTRVATRSIGMNEVSSQISARLASKRGGVNFHPMLNLPRKTADSVAYRKELKDKRAAELRNGPGGVESPLINKRKEALGKLRTVANTAKGPAIVIAVVCAANGMNDAVDAQNLESQLQAKRMGWDRIIMGSQVAWGYDFNAEQLGVYKEDLWDPKTQTAWADDPGIRHELGEAPTANDYIADLDLGAAKPGFFTAYDSVAVFAGALINPVCAAVAAVGDAPVIKQVSDLIGAGLNGLLAAVGAKSTEEYMQMAIDYFANGGVNVMAQGAERGGIENVGARMSANDQFLAMGGRELSEAEENEVKTAVREENARVFARSSIYDKYFNLYDTRSMAASLYMKAPKNSTQFVASLNGLPNTLSSLFMQFAGTQKAHAQNPQVLPDYKYEFPLISYSLAERNDPRFENPFANEIYMLDDDPTRLDRMNTEYGTVCFNMTVTREGSIQYGESGDFNKIPDKCWDESNIELTHYRFYLAQLINGLTIDCHEGNEESCRLLGMGDQVGTAPATGTAGNTIVGDPYTDSTTVSCDPRTKDLGEATGYSNGTPFNIRLCSVPNIPSNGQSDNPGTTYSTPGASGSVIVNSRVSGAWFTLAADAATAGVQLSANSSYRSMAHQEALFAATPDPTLVARPGYSSHQAAVAIDFTGMNAIGGETCATRATHSSAGYQWLRANAEKYGFKQYAKEAWHWDALQSTTRCGTNQP